MLRQLQLASKLGQIFCPTGKTRAPRGTDRSPEYNEHFFYKLDSRVKY